VALVDAEPIVSRWSTHWPLGSSPAVSSVLDVLCGDVLESEGRERPAGAIVVGRDRIDSEALAHWTLYFPNGPRRGIGSIFFREPARLLARVTRLGEDAAARRAAFESLLASLEPIPWSRLSDMEVISLAMGHFGPARQAQALPLIEGALVTNAAAAAAASMLERGMAIGATIHAIAALGSSAAAAYSPAFRSLARISSDAFEELARRATERGIKTAGPFSLPVNAWVPTLAGNAK